MAEDGPKLSRVAVVGAWLGIWEPPRGARVPPVPWRRLGLGALALLVVAGAVAAFAVPRIDGAKDRAAARERRGLDERAAARRARVEREQRPRLGTAPGVSRAAILGAVEDRIGADARERFDPRARTAACEPAPGADGAAARVAFDCTTAVADVFGAGDQEGARGTLAIPYRAVVDFAAGTYAFCKVNPPPGEQVVPDPRQVVALPRACRG